MSTASTSAPNSTSRDRRERLRDSWVRHTHSKVVVPFEDDPTPVDRIFRRRGELTPTLVREAPDLIDRDPALRERLLNATREAASPL